MATLAYFDMFDYPLKKKEIFLFLSQSPGSVEFDAALLSLLDNLLVFKLQDCFSLRNNFTLVDRRHQGNARAEMMLVQAKKGARLLSAFPYVRAVAISGSLSKNFADESADIDFFIITAKNRLWIARSFLHLFKKFTFLFNRQHFFCMNYFVDELQLEILEKNIYTATEIATLLPLHGNESFDNFYASNTWTNQLLPNNIKRVSSAKPLQSGWLKGVMEKIFSGAAGDSLDKFLMKLTVKSWAAKEKHQKKNSRGIIMALDASRHYAKPSPLNFQQKLLRHYEHKTSELIESWEDNIQATSFRNTTNY